MVVNIYKFETQQGTKGFVQSEDLYDAECIIRQKLDIIFGSISIECVLSNFELIELKNTNMVISEW